MASELTCPRPPRYATAIGAALCGVILTLAGCRSVPAQTPVAQQWGGSEPESQLEFWHTLADRGLTSNDDAFHGLLLFLDGADPAADYAGRVAELQKRKMLPRKFAEPADAAVKRGVLAVGLARGLKIRGGLTMRLVGPTPRYATRELYFLGIYPPGSQFQTFTGAEYLGIIGRAEDHLRGQKVAIQQIRE